MFEAGHLQCRAKAPRVNKDMLRFTQSVRVATLFVLEGSGEVLVTLVDEAEDIFVIHVLLVKEVKLMRLWTTRVYCQVIFCLQTILISLIRWSLLLRDI